MWNARKFRKKDSNHQDKFRKMKKSFNFCVILFFFYFVIYCNITFITRIYIAPSICCPTIKIRGPSAISKLLLSALAVISCYLWFNVAYAYVHVYIGL